MSEPTPEPRSDPGRRIIVLVVDDDAYMRLLVRRILEHRGHTVLEAADGVEGVSVFRQDHKRIHVVVMEIELPRMNGIDAFQEMRAIRTDIPVIAVSGYASQNYRHRLPVANLAGTLRKPFEPDELLAAVSRCQPCEGAFTEHQQRA